MGTPASGVIEQSARLGVHRRGHWLARQRLVGEPATEAGLGRIVEGDDREVIEDEAAVPTYLPPVNHKRVEVHDRVG